MENIIKGILEIEQQAQEKIERAEFERNKIIADAKSKEVSIIEKKIAEAEDDLKKSEIAEKEKSDAKLAEINAMRESEIKRLNEVLNTRKDEWQEKIFTAIING